MPAVKAKRFSPPGAPASRAGRPPHTVGRWAGRPPHTVGRRKYPTGRLLLPDLPAGRRGELLFDFDRDLELVDSLLAARSLELQRLVLDDLEPDRQRSPGRLRHEHLGG